MAVKLALAFGTLLIVTLIILSLIAAGTWLIDRALDAWDYGDEDEQVRGRTDDGKIMVDAEKHRELQARVKDLEHEIKMAKRHLRDVLSERHAIEAALSDERQKAKKLEAENAELRRRAEQVRIAISERTNRLQALRQV